jgi:hypothetical protein
MVAKVLEPGCRVDRGLREPSKSNQTIVGERGRADGVGHRAEDLGWQSEAGPVQGDNVQKERPANLELH